MHKNAETVAHALGGAKRTGLGWLCRCPAHDDNKASLSVTDGFNGKLLVKCHALCSQEAVLSALRARDLFGPSPVALVPGVSTIVNNSKQSERKLIDTYDYVDESGALLYQALRYEPKDFRQRAANGAWSIKDCRIVLYRLPEVIKAAQQGTTIYVVEGEKDVHAAESMGLVATTAPMGAGKWRSEFTEFFKGANVVICPDNDSAGLKYCDQLIAALGPVAKSLRVFKTPTGKDLSDFTAQGGTLSQLIDATIEVTKPEPAKGLFLRITNIEDDLKPIQWLVRDYLEDDALTLVFGPPASGKSFIALSMACAVATGTNWHGKASTKGAVFYIAGEGHNGIKRRLAAWQRDSGYNLNDGDFYKSHKAVDILNLESAQSVRDEIELLHKQSGVTPRMVIIDTLARNFGAGDENVSADMSKFINHIDDNIRRPFGCNVMIVHHSGHNADRARGSSALRAAVDAEYGVSVDEGGVVTLKTTKMKDADYPADMLFKFKKVELKEIEGEMVSSCVLVQSGDEILDRVISKTGRRNQITAAQIIDALDGGWHSVQAFGDKLSVSKSVAQRTLSDAIESGILVKSGTTYVVSQEALDKNTTRGSEILKNASKPFRADLDG